MYSGMKRGVKKITIILCFIAIVVLSDDCSSVIFHDKTNPCTPGSNSNTIECIEWQKKFPKEYKHYLKRQENNVKSN